MSNPVIRILNDRIAGRSIATDPLDEPVVADLMEAARLSPSCFNNQPWRFLFLESDPARAKGVEALSAGNVPWAGTAPLLILGYTRAQDDCIIKDGRRYHQFDLGLSVMNILLAATYHGLTARPMAGFSPAKAKELFGLEEPDEPLIMIAVGKPSSDESHLPDHAKGKNDLPRERKDVSEIIRRL